MKKLKTQIILFFILLLYSQAYTQEQTPPADSSGFSIFDIFSYEHPVKKGGDEKKWSLNIGTGYMGKNGNTDSLDINYSASIKFEDNITAFKINFLGFYGETKGVKDENHWNAQGNFDHYLLSRVEFFSFTMSDYNEMIGLHHRNDSGVGLKLIFIRNNYLLVDLSAAPVYQYEKFDTMEKDDEWRWSVRWRGTILPFRDDITVRYYGYYIPELSNRGNYRLIHDLYAYFKLAESLGISAGYRRDFNTYTPELLTSKPELKKTDETTYLQLSITI